MLVNEKEKTFFQNVKKWDWYDLNFMFFITLLSMWNTIYIFFKFFVKKGNVDFIFISMQNRFLPFSLIDENKSDYLFFIVLFWYKKDIFVIYFLFKKTYFFLVCLKW